MSYGLFELFVTESSVGEEFTVYENICNLECRYFRSLATDYNLYTWLQIPGTQCQNMRPNRRTI